MKLIITLIILLSTLQATSLKNLSINQQVTMRYVFEKGKEYDLQLTLTAIAWQESQFGLYVINIQDVSCGVFHIMPKSLIKRTDLKNNGWNQSRLCERLIEDIDFSISASVLELKFWLNYWESKGVSKVWSHAVSSYNGGFKGKVNSKYVQDVKTKIKLLRKYYENTKIN